MTTGSEPDIGVGGITPTGPAGTVHTFTLPPPTTPAAPSSLVDPRVANRLRRILRADSVQIQRPTTNAGIVTYPQVYDGFGTHQGPTPTNMRPAGLADDVNIDDSLSFTSDVDIREADRAVTPRGTFTVLAVTHPRFRVRAFLRKLG